MSDSAPPGGPSDAAALSAAVVVVVITVLVGPGAYNVLGAIVSLTLFFLILGYLWTHPRTVWQSLALSSIIGGVAVPLVGFIVELYWAADRWCLLKWDNPMNPKIDDDISGVNNFWGIGTWLVVGAIVFMVDRRQQKRL
jgi:hypothetical protein